MTWPPQQGKSQSAAEIRISFVDFDGNIVVEFGESPEHRTHLFGGEKNRTSFKEFFRGFVEGDVGGTVECEAKVESRFGAAIKPHLDFRPGAALCPGCQAADLIRPKDAQQLAAEFLLLGRLVGASLFRGAERRGEWRVVRSP